MSQIDWSKAPDDATHCWPNVPEFYKCEGGVWLVWYMKAQEWHKAELEIRILELIPRPSQAWTGTGLPPVGTVCEMQDDVGRWIKVEIIASHAGLSHGWEASSKESFYSDKPEEFRPIRTHEQIAAEEREAAIQKVRECLEIDEAYTIQRIVEELYAAGYRITKREGE